MSTKHSKEKASGSMLAEEEKTIGSKASPRPVENLPSLTNTSSSPLPTPSPQLACTLNFQAPANQKDSARFASNIPIFLIT